ncbi:sulfur carrier protein ThiS [Kamptonema cortianum]|nr:sulfur carrier protein ThiS [Kamptonema cortianum]MDL5050080.1 sulfur carrier protein ThiS [Oscillatoria amoena NRMC-F 0135]
MMSSPQESSPEQVALRANGEEITVSADATIESFLRGRGIEPRCVAVEINGEAVLRSEWPARKLREGDRVEVIRVVAGG